MSLQRLFDRVISGKSAAGMQAEQLLQLEYFRKTVPTEILSPPLPPSPALQQLQGAIPVQEPAAPDLNQPMEIGVFDVKDFM